MDEAEKQLRKLVIIVDKVNLSLRPGLGGMVDWTRRMVIGH